MEQKTQINNAVNTQTEEVYRDILEEILLPMFNAWFDSIDTKGELAKLPGKVIAESYGCTVNSGLAMMFTGFAGGAMAALFSQGKDEAAGE